MHWILDSLPVAMLKPNDNIYERGFPVGSKTVSLIANKKDNKVAADGEAAAVKSKGLVGLGGVSGDSSNSQLTSSYFLNNHVRIVIEYNDDHTRVVDAKSDVPYTIRIVNFRVEPMSVKHSWGRYEFLYVILTFLIFT